jgi:hypothetical protein
MTEANKLSDGFLPIWRTCPYCGSNDSRILLTLSNLVRVAGNMFAHVLRPGIDILDFPVRVAGLPFTLRRRCRQCQASFRVESLKPELLSCGQCGYNLTGNISGICPECGWIIPEDIRQQVSRCGQVQRTAGRPG